MSTKPQSETLGFQAEVKQLLQLVTHSLYSNKEIFLRELISNASDAADKLRYESLSDSALFENDTNLKVWIDIDKEKRTITIRDNGIGMSREEVIKNLGTIAESGTREFMKTKLTGDQAKDAHMIGQFGVGFYSSFIVAENVIVRTRRGGMQSDQGVEWESKGEGEYTIKNIDKKDRGTEVVLHIRKEDEEFLDEWRIQQIIRKYSDHILLPIVMKKTEVLEAKEGEEPKTEVKEEVVNQATALWTLPKNKIKDQEYNDLYKHIAHDFEDPLVWSHNKVEGKLEYTSLLYIPSHAPFDMWDRNRPRGLKLYVRRVFIMDDAEQLLPLYLRFVRGIVDSNDLPLNVSRELLQSSQVIESIRSACVKRVLDVLDDLAERDKEKYQKFWNEFGQVIKEGPGEDFANRDRIVKLLRFATTHHDMPEQTVSLADYVSRMSSEQKYIYYITAENFTTARNSPNLEIFRKKGIEVILLYDRVDEWLVSHLTEFEGKKLQSVAKGDLDLGTLENKEETEKVAKAKTEFSTVLEQMKKVLGEKVKEVRVTDRLTDSPVCIVTDENTASIHLLNMLKAAGQPLPTVAPILEVNPDHPLIQRLKDVQDEEKFGEWSWVLLDQAQLAQGVQLEDPNSFVKRLNRLLAD